MRIFDTRWEGAHGIGRFATEVFSRLKGYERIELGGSPAAPLGPWRLGAYLRRRAPEFFLSPGYVAPAGRCCPYAITVHDLNHLHVRGNSSWQKRVYYQAVLRPAIHRAQVVLTVSEFSRKQICEWAGVQASKVINVSHGIADVFKASGERYSAQRPYFLFVGNHKAHKNLRRIIAAFGASKLQPDFQLYVTGTASHALLQLVTELELRDFVKFVGAPSDGELASLYRGATALVMASLYEGFGLPVIEAMACGTPVITSNVASMPEVAGGAALLVDPFNSGEITVAMRMLASDEKLRLDLRRSGLAHAATFTWCTTMERVRLALEPCS